MSAYQISFVASKLFSAIQLEIQNSIMSRKIQAYLNKQRQIGKLEYKNSAARNNNRKKKLC